MVTGQPTGDEIRFNVGGKNFSTSRSTLAAAGDSYFSDVMAGHAGIPRDPLGRVIIDRDPKMFRYILNYLRSQGHYLSAEMDSGAKLTDLLFEAGYYKVWPLIKCVLERLLEIEGQEWLERSGEAQPSRYNAMEYSDLISHAAAFMDSDF